MAKSYTPDRPAEFAGGLVEIVPQKISNRQVFDASAGFNWYETSTGKDILLSPLDGNDWWGFDDSRRALPVGFPADKVVRRGIFTPEVGYSRDEITAFGRLLDTTAWRPRSESGSPGQNFSLSYGNRFGKLGVLASVTQSYKEQFVEENRRELLGVEYRGASTRYSSFEVRRDPALRVRLSTGEITTIRLLVRCS